MTPELLEIIIAEIKAAVTDWGYYASEYEGKQSLYSTRYPFRYLIINPHKHALVGDIIIEFYNDHMEVLCPYPRSSSGVFNYDRDDLLGAVKTAINLPHINLPHVGRSSNGD